MLAFLPTFIRLPLALLLVVLNVLVHASVLLALALIKALVPIAGFRRWISLALVAIAEQWIAVNGGLFALVTRTRWRVDGLQGLDRHGWYLVLSNHQSWVDIPVLQKTFNRRIPFLKFFLKQQLKWMPVLGLAWWALDFPFMQRYTKQQLEAHPQWRGKDKQATRKACEKFRQSPVSVMNFVEGTRFTSAKHAQQQSPYANLLRPRAGGVAFVLEAMGDMLQAIIDVTIVYPNGKPTMIDLLADRIPEIRVHVRQLSIPLEFIGGDYENDAAFRARFQGWIGGLWAEKDARITQLRAADSAIVEGFCESVAVHNAGTSLPREAIIYRDRRSTMKWAGMYLVGFIVLIGGILAALWQLGILQNIGTTWTAIGIVIVVGLGIMVSVSHSGIKENIEIDRK